MTKLKTLVIPIVAAFLLGAAIFVPSKDDLQKIDADNGNFTFVGRVNFSTAKAPKFSHAGVQIYTRFTGSYLEIELDDYSLGGDEHTNYFKITCDDIDTLLQTTAGKQKYLISNSLKDTIHNLMIFKRTECLVGKTAFLGIRISNNAELMKPALPSRKIEWIGDSKTCGYGNMVSRTIEENPNTGFHSVNENNYLAWGAITSRKLNTQYMCTAISGRGVYRNFDNSRDGVIPSEYEQCIPEESNKWEFERYQPDLVVVNLGTNDFGPDAFENPPNLVDSAVFVSSYISFLNTVSEKNPNAKIIVSIGNMMTDNWPAKIKRLSRLRSYTKSVISQMKASGFHDIYFFELKPQSPPFGENWHPTVKTHHDMSDQITPFIKEIMNW